eukprot:maker-scaffold1055_size66517-snap-gene-0.7 protein:Tk09594 transcript:maker-scaffold1055_size66517-snap-gene-0.7-mRNA-1 annotation:"cuticle protein 6"
MCQGIATIIGLGLKTTLTFKTAWNDTEWKSSNKKLELVEVSNNKDECQKLILLTLGTLGSSQICQAGHVQPINAALLVIVLSSVLAAASAGIIAAPYSAGLPYAAGYHPYSVGLPYAAANLPYTYTGAPLAASLPVTYQNQLGRIQYNAAPVVAAPLAHVSSQYQSQDEFGNINYGYANINSAKQEVGNAYGGVTGSYSYVDANGIPQRVDYIADGLGYRVKATNLPVGPVNDLVSPVYEGVAPEPVEDTPE